MNQIIDALLVFRADANGVVTPSALVSTLVEGGEIVRTWANTGSIGSDGGFYVAGQDIVIEVHYVEAGLQAYRDKLAAGDANPHHTIVAKGTINGADFVAFPDKEGRRLSLKPDTRASEGVAVPGLAG